MFDDRKLIELEHSLQNLCETSAGRRAFLTTLPFLLAACAAQDKHRYREGSNEGQATKLTVDDERRMTSEVLPKLKKDYPTLDNPKMQNYLSSLGHKLAQRSHLEGQPYNYNFTVVATPMVNAFALPAGTIFVTAPLIAMADTEAELAGVVGHEIGHVKARHAAERIDKEERERGKTIGATLGGGLLGGLIGFGLGKLLCPKNDNSCVAKATGAGAVAGAGAGLLIRKYAFMANSREDEMEADRIGFRVATEAGYSKDHAGDFYSKLLEMEKKHGGGGGGMGFLADALSTHPPSQERINQMNQMEQETVQKSGVTSSKDFDSIRVAAQEWTKQNTPPPKT